MRERIQSIGRIGIAGAAIATAGSACTPESEYIKGTVVDMREEPEGHRTEIRVQNLSDCPEGTTHLSNRCAPKTYEVTVDIWDAVDRVLTLQDKNGNIFEAYVWPRIYNNTSEGESVRIHPRYGKLYDYNNQETIISKKPAER